MIAATPERAILRTDIYDRPVLRAWGRGRLTLLGDAAHPMTPNLGQGACQALEDAVVLGACLQTGRPLAAALRAYEAQRLPRANALVGQARLLGAVAQWECPAAVRLRNMLLEHLGPRLQTRQLDALIGHVV